MSFIEIIQWIGAFLFTVVWPVTFLMLRPSHAAMQRGITVNFVEAAGEKNTPQIFFDFQQSLDLSRVWPGAHGSSRYTIGPRPRGLTFTWWGCCGLCLWHKPTELAHSSFLFCFCVYFCLCGPLSCISFHKFSRQLSAFSLCSSGLMSALLVLSTTYLFTKVSFSSDVILCGWLGYKYQLTN